MRHYHKKRQQGATALLTLVFMIGMLGIIGLAIDTGHILVNKTRLQNALDAAALSAAITRNGSSNNSIAESIAAGITTFELFKKSTGNTELKDVQLTAANFLFSDYVSNFFPANGTGPFVRVQSNALRVGNFFIQVITRNSSQNVGAVATAGPVGQNCNLVPLVICADVDPDTGEMDKDCSDEDPGEPGIKECYGYIMNEENELHQHEFCKHSDTDCVDTELESGNFTLLRWDGDAGKNDVYKSLSEGSANTCSTEIGLQLESEPGFAVGPVASGINERFYADTVNSIYDNVTHPTADTPAYDTYIDDQELTESSSYNPDGIINNRIVQVPIGDCTGIQKGNTTFDFAADGSGNMAAACVLIRRPVRQTGSDKNPDYLKNSIYFEMLELCPASGKTDPTNPVIYGPFKIVLFKSENSGDS